jgi:hypothetical protein
LLIRRIQATYHIPEERKVTVKSLADKSKSWPEEIGSVELVGGGKLRFMRDETGIHVTLPEKLPTQTALAMKIQERAFTLMK